MSVEILVSRRNVMWICAVAACALPTVASAQPRLEDGAYTVSELSPTERPGFVALDPPGTPAWARTRARVVPVRHVLSSMDNGNTRYSLFLEYRRGRGECTEGLLRLGPTATRASSWGSSPGVCALHFELSPALADLAAAHFRVRRLDRRPIGERVTATFSTPRAVYQPGEPVPIVLTFHNPPDAPRVLRVVGGRNRGPRNNRFSLQITRDGAPVAEIEGWDFGGLSTTVSIEPGGDGTVEEEVGRWGDLSAPGHYLVECRYETELHPDGFSYRDASSGEVWDGQWTGTVRFEVRAPR